ncbi:MAG TPA: hypothetical protein H9881_15860 [Candidatus Stackebrandtia excrementipullorum]|nr:hypothetical protein [Candidatus Stackebrandtia excrementipullorum]
MVITSAGSTQPRPRALTSGFGVVIAAAVAAVIATVLWILMYQHLAPNSGRALSQSARASLGTLDGLAYITIGLSLLLAIGLAAGAVTMWYGSNVGRILVWVFGGVSIAWHLCCGSYNLLFSSAISAAGQYMSNEQRLTMWLMNAAFIAGFVTAILCIVGIILIAQPSVNIYFRKLSGKPMPRPGSSRHHSVPGPYEPFGAAPAPPTHWPYTGDNTIPRQSSSDGLTRPLGDDTMWRKPASSDGDEQPFEPPR